MTLLKCDCGTVITTRNVTRVRRWTVTEATQLLQGNCPSCDTTRIIAKKVQSRFNTEAVLDVFRKVEALRKETK